MSFWVYDTSATGRVRVRGHRSLAQAIRTARSVVKEPMHATRTAEAQVETEHGAVVCRVHVSARGTTFLVYVNEDWRAAVRKATGAKTI